MARKPLSGDVSKITEEIGKSYEGTYGGVRHVDAGHKNPDLTTKLSAIHTLETEDGPFSFWGFTSIDNILRDVRSGTYLWIKYKGKVKGKNGMAHSATVEYDDETVPAKAPTPASADPDLSLIHI